MPAHVAGIPSHPVDSNTVPNGSSDGGLSSSGPTGSSCGATPSGGDSTGSGIGDSSGGTDLGSSTGECEDDVNSSNSAFGNKLSSAAVISYMVGLMYGTIGV